MPPLLVSLLTIKSETSSANLTAPNSLVLQLSYKVAISFELSESVCLKLRTSFMFHKVLKVLICKSNNKL